MGSGCARSPGVQLRMHAFVVLRPDLSHLPLSSSPAPSSISEVCSFVSPSLLRAPAGPAHDNILACMHADTIMAGMDRYASMVLKLRPCNDWTRAQRISPIRGWALVETRVVHTQ